MFSLSIEDALSKIAEYDSTIWAKFSFYPCPVGADTPNGCKTNPCPPKIQPCNHETYLECCVKDKLEDCLVATLGCNPDLNPGANCTMDTRVKLAKFLGCFEGGHIEEDHCPQDALNCSKYAGFDASVYPAVERCLADDTMVAKAADTLARDCTAQNISNWPHVLVDGGVTYDIIPVLPTLCKMYKGATPKSCSLLAQGLITTV
eukprot:m.33034 g.33034  ORF g.33034 m.33034 type:complete len:204 (+) comp16748_c0_seq1:163-774(+)